MKEILLITWFRTLIFDTETLLEVEIKTRKCSAIETFIKGIQCVTEDASGQLDNYLASFQVNESKIDESNFKNIAHEVMSNKVMFHSLIYRCKYDKVENLFVNENSREDSILIKDEKVENILEYTSGQMIVSVYPTDLLIIHDWRIVSII